MILVKTVIAVLAGFPFLSQVSGFCSNDCDFSNADSLGQCIQQRLILLVASTPTTIPLSDFDGSYGAFRLHVTGIELANLNQATVGVPTVNLNDTRVDISVPVQWTNIGTSLQFRIQFELFYHTRTIHASSDVWFSDTRGSANAELNIEQQPTCTHVGLVSYSIDVQLPEDIEADVTVSGFPQWMQAYVGDPGEGIEYAIKYMWWPTVQPNLNQAIQQALENFIKEYTNE